MQQLAHDRRRMVGSQKKLRQPALDFRRNGAGDIVVVGHRAQALNKARREPPSVRGPAREIPALQTLQTGREVCTRRIEWPSLRRLQQLPIERRWRLQADVVEPGLLDFGGEARPQHTGDDLLGMLADAG